MEEVKVEQNSETDKDIVFSVEVDEGSSTKHKVTVAKEDLNRLSPTNTGAHDLVKESFKFLLEREPKESILSRFNLTTIEDYFPEYREKIKNRLQDRTK
ncbi:hypothetical protein KGY79_04870 [Candidatus Bipolaricaulota bacterium]|nr:hypothetical protein [Candidatus Bipolaricaulota bacterium]